MNWVDSEDSGSEKRFRLVVSWHRLTRCEHEKHGDSRVQRDIDDVVSVRRETTNVVVHSVATHNDVTLIHTRTKIEHISRKLRSAGSFVTSQKDV